MAKSSSRRPEQSDASGKAVFAFGVGLAVFIMVTIFVLLAIFGVPPRPQQFGAGFASELRPMLQIDPRADRKAYDAEKTVALNSLGWTDEQAGIAHIPIADAMRLVAEHGVPDWGQHTSPQATTCRDLLAVPRAPQAQRCQSAWRTTP